MQVHGFLTCPVCGREQNWPHRPICDDGLCPGHSRSTPVKGGPVVSLEGLFRMTFPVGPGCVAPEGTPASPDFRVSIQEVNEHGVRFIVHADGHDSETLDFLVQGNRLTQL